MNWNHCYLVNKRLISYGELAYAIALTVVVLFSGCTRCKDGCVHGICQNRTCICDTYWEGDACNRNFFSNYTGTYSGNNSCIISGENQSYKMSLTSNEAGMNFDGMDLSFTTDTRFRLPEQTYRGSKIEGEGQMQVERISITYFLLDSINSGSCLIEAQRD